MLWFEALLAAMAIAAALAMRPWRGVGPAGPPWPWLAWAAALPMMWGADRFADSAVAQPLSGACLLMLMMGWPLAVLAMVPVALVTMFAGGLTPEAGLERFVWLGLMPATMAVVFGAAVRRWLQTCRLHPRPRLLRHRGGRRAGRGAAALLHPPPGGLGGDDLALARWLAAWGDAWLAGILVAIFVAFRPHWLATYTDRLYLPRT
ncbi:MAG: hypothetical protein QM702_15700 [Rubrivivax sp.]